MKNIYKIFIAVEKENDFHKIAMMLASECEASGMSEEKFMEELFSTLFFLKENNMAISEEDFE